MSNSTLHSNPTYTADDARARETFLALMWALSYPGQVQTLPGQLATIANGLALVGDALLDLEATYFTTDDGLADQLKHSGARLLPPYRAAYHFYPLVDAKSLGQIELASSGTAQFPDEAATLVLGADFSSGLTLTLHGPGINGSRSIQVDGVPEKLWQLRTKIGIYPLGWDLFLIDSRGHLIGLPRTTRINEMEG